jgi:hypothetical protein
MSEEPARNIYGLVESSGLVHTHRISKREQKAREIIADAGYKSLAESEAHRHTHDATRDYSSVHLKPQEPSSFFHACVKCKAVYEFPQDIMCSARLCPDCVMETCERCLTSVSENEVKWCTYCGLTTCWECVAVVWCQSTNCVCKDCVDQYESSLVCQTCNTTWQVKDLIPICEDILTQCPKCK